MPSPTITTAGRAAEDLGLAALLGGNLFGRLAMHPAVRGVCTPEDRGKVVSAAWRRYGTVNSLSLAAVLAGWLTTRDEIGDPQVARAKDAAVGAVALTGIASALEGVRFARSAPGGSVPLESGSEPAAQAPPDAARTKRLLNTLGRLSALAEVALVGINAVAAQPPRTRRLRLSRR
ncbi:MAG: hypothetical protein QOF37_597 [Thermoleophilaceae bacterium]|jgi:hypothetical protein|nr:hypothetical protein [Thermoleophilaceae bacterium]